MKLVVNGFEMWIGDVRINLRRRNIAVSEHRLHAAQVGAVHQ